MTTWKRASVSAAAIGSLALLLSACSSMGTQQSSLGQPEQLQPIQDGAVASTDLPTIGQAGVPQTAQTGAPPVPGQVNPALTGQPVLGGNQIGEPVQTAGTDGSFVTLELGGHGAQRAGPRPDRRADDREAAWAAGPSFRAPSSASSTSPIPPRPAPTATAPRRRAASCRASRWWPRGSWRAPRCSCSTRTATSIAALILSGNRFIGTLAGGQGISMVG